MDAIPHPKRKKTSARAETEAAILAAAELIFAEHGFGGATTAAVARLAGVPKSNLHYYFATKELLYRAVLAKVLDAWVGAATSLRIGEPARDALRAYIDAKMDLARRYPLPSRIFASEIMRGAPLVQDFLETTLRAWMAEWETVIRGWIADGALRPVEPRTLIYMIWAATQHYADFAHQIRTLNGGVDPTPEQFDLAKRQVAATILDGVAPRGSAQERAGDLPRSNWHEA